MSLPPPLRFRRVFHDSSAYAAVLNRTDRNHETARAILRDIIATRYRTVTTNVILIEAHALILSEMGISAAHQFLREMQSGSTLVVRVRASDEAAARDLLFHYADKAWSLADATSFVVMERLDIRYAFTFDSDFAQYGFTPLTPGLLS